jgi:hypothetical protein
VEPETSLWMHVQPRRKKGSGPACLEACRPAAFIVA